MQRSVLVVFSLKHQTEKEMNIIETQREMEIRYETMRIKKGSQTFSRME